MTPLRFRAWHKEKKMFLKEHDFCIYKERPVAVARDISVHSMGGGPDEWGFRSVYGEVKYDDNIILMQSSGLTDKNEPCVEVFEGDIISLDGRVIGNQWENPSLLESDSNLLVTGLGTETWFTTHQEAVARGCLYPKRHAD